MASVQVDGLDHVHVEVADRHAAARWYGRTLGLVPAEEFAIWADDLSGPLFLRTASGRNALALFTRDWPDVDDRSPGNRVVAFAIDGAGFIAFAERLSEVEITGAKGQRLSQDDIVDHDLSWSLYFRDPDGNPFELTTYDYAFVEGGLSDARTARSGQP